MESGEARDVSTRGGTRRDLYRAIEEKDRHISRSERERMALVRYCWLLANDTLPQAREIRESILAHGVEATLRDDPDLTMT